MEGGFEPELLSRPGEELGREESCGDHEAANLGADLRGHGAGDEVKAPQVPENGEDEDIGDNHPFRNCQVITGSVVGVQPIQGFPGSTFEDLLDRDLRPHEEPKVLGGFHKWKVIIGQVAPKEQQASLPPLPQPQVLPGGEKSCLCEVKAKPTRFLKVKECPKRGSQLPARPNQGADVIEKGLVINALLPQPPKQGVDGDNEEQGGQRAALFDPLLYPNTGSPALIKSGEHHDFAEETLDHLTEEERKVHSLKNGVDVAVVDAVEGFGEVGQKEDKPLPFRQGAVVVPGDVIHVVNDIPPWDDRRLVN